MDDVEAADVAHGGGVRSAEELDLGELSAPAPDPCPTLAREHSELVEQLDERADLRWSSTSRA